MRFPGAPAMTHVDLLRGDFPRVAVTPAARPGWFVNITNDSWFGPLGRSPPASADRAAARHRRRSARSRVSAITGISAVIDGRGKIVTSLGLNQSGVIDAWDCREALAPTPYARFGDLGFAIIFACMRHNCGRPVAAPVRHFDTILLFALRVRA